MIKELYMNGKSVGVYNKDTKVYTAHRNPEHFMFKFGGFGLSQQIIDELISLGCDTVLIAYHGANGIVRYKASLNDFNSSMKTHVFNGTDFQKFVSARDMENLDARQTPPQNTPTPKINNKQTTLKW